MRVLIVTGSLAYPLIEDVVGDVGVDVIVHVADTQVAAFLTPRQVVREVRDNFSSMLDDIDMILVPGLMKKSASFISKELGVPTFKGPTDGADLGMVLGLLGEVDLSEDRPADKLIEDEKRRFALRFIEDFEGDRVNVGRLLSKESNILIRDLPVGEDFPMRVLAEIANAPLLSEDELVRKCRFFLDSGADMIDIGMVAGEDFSDVVPDLVGLLRSVVGDVPLSIDSLNPSEIRVACECGVDLVLSLDLGNYSEVLDVLCEYGVPAVLLPTNFSEGVSPESSIERVRFMERLIGDVGGDIDYVVDLILDPVNSSSIVESIIACNEFRKISSAPMFFGVGNVTELMDVDSGGVNALLAGIGMELGVGILFTPEESGKTYGSVRELSVASKMMFLSKHRNSIPKDLGIDLVDFKDKRKRFDFEGLDIGGLDVVQQDNPMKFVKDGKGSFKISVDYDNRRIKAVHFFKNRSDVVFVGDTAQEVYEEIIHRGLVSRMEHAAYLGSELKKAEIAMVTGKNYIQDFDLFKKSK